MRISIEPREAHALHRLRGLPDGAHLLLMTSRGDTLEGSQEAFDELVERISDDLVEDMVSRADRNTLVALCLKIDPSCVDWLGV